MLKSRKKMVQKTEECNTTNTKSGEEQIKKLIKKMYSLDYIVVRGYIEIISRNDLIINKVNQ